MAQQSTQRVAYLDILRIIATFGVIFIHVTADGLPVSFLQSDWFVAVVGDSLVRWAVPVFVMISGALFLNPRRNVTAEIVVFKKAPRLLISYVAWWLIYALAIVAVWHVFKHEAIQTDWLMPCYHLWFLPMLVGMYLLTPLLRLIAADEKLLRYVLLIWICYILGSFFIVNDFKQITQLFTMNIGVGYAGYYLLGYYLFKLNTSCKQRTIIYILGILGAVITIGGNLFLSINKGENNEMFMNPLSLHVAMMSMALFVFVKNISITINPVINSVVEYVRKDLFGIYLTHALWLMVINKEFFRDLCSHAVSLPIITVVTFVLSLYTTKLLRKIPIIKKIVET